MRYKIKTNPEEFLVSEISNIQTTLSQDKYKIFLLEKKGYSTFDAIASLSSYLSIDQAEVGYAGLKDEDGITKQKISIPSNLINEKHVEAFNRKFIDRDKYMHITYIGFTRKKIAINNLLGNSFKIRIRNMEKREVDYLLKVRKINLNYVNYYGIQRFGLPDKEKKTHLIGKFLLQGDYEEAFKLACTVEDNFDKSINSSYYFEKMDFRKRSFYYNAYSSYVFNESLSNLVKEYSQNVLNEEENISFYFPINENGILNIWAHKKMLPIKRYYYDESNNLTEKRSSRLCISNSVVKIIQVQEDEIYHKWSADIEFMLPSGNYATVAIMQLENIMSNLLEKSHEKFIDF